MPDITIQGHKFTVPADPAIVAGAILDENMAASLQQTRLENIRNNMAARIKKLLNGAEELTPEQLAQTQSEVERYASEYKFGVRSVGTRTVDPVEREALRLAKEDIAAAFYAKHKERLKGEQLADAAEKLLEARREDYVKRARRNIRDREQAGAEVLAQAGI